MRVVDLHPEDLLDREMQGDLTDVEHERLTSHLARCETCRFERLARQDFESELLEQYTHEDDVAHLVNQVLQSTTVVTIAAPPSSRRVPELGDVDLGLHAGDPLESSQTSLPAAQQPANDERRSPAPESAPVESIALSMRSRARRLFIVSLIAATFLLVGAAAAASWSGVLRPLFLVSTTESSETASSPTAEPRKSGARSASPKAVKQAAVAPAVSSVGAADEPSNTHDESVPSPIDSATVASLEPVANVAAVRDSGGASSRDIMPSGAKAASLSDATHPAHVGTKSEPVATTPVDPLAEANNPQTTSQSRAAELFSKANLARRSGNDSAAIAAYRELIEAFPKSPEASVGRASMARILLDRGESADALRKYDESLAAGAGALTEEMLLGRATSLERIGNSASEAAAWSALLRAFPSSIHAARARERLAVIGSR